MSSYPKLNKKLPISWNPELKNGSLEATLRIPRYACADVFSLRNPAYVNFYIHFKNSTFDLKSK